MTDTAKTKWLELGEAMGWVQGDAPAVPLPDTGIPIADRAALDAALKAAKGGEVFRLAAGDYGSLEIKPNYSPPITIAGGTFGSIKILRFHWQKIGKGLALDGVKAGYIEVNAVDGVAIRNSVCPQVVAKITDGLSIERCLIDGGEFSIRLQDTINFRLVGNIVQRAGEDAIRIYGNSHDGIVSGNVVRDMDAAKPLHADLFQVYGMNERATAPYNIIFEDNLLFDDVNGKTVVHRKGSEAGKAGIPQTGQGFFIAGSRGTANKGFRGIVVRRNLIRVSAANAIFVSGATEDYLVEDNIVVPVDGQHVARIVVNTSEGQNPGATIRRNVTTMIGRDGDENAAKIEANHLYGAAVPAGLFAGITQTAGGDAPEDYRAAPGSPLSDMPWLEGTIAVIRATLDAVPTA